MNSKQWLPGSQEINTIKCSGKKKILQLRNEAFDFYSTGQFFLFISYLQMLCNVTTLFTVNTTGIGRIILMHTWVTDVWMRLSSENQHIQLALTSVVIHLCSICPILWLMIRNKVQSYKATPVTYCIDSLYSLFGLNNTWKSIMFLCVKKETIAVWNFYVTDVICQVFQATNEFSRPSILHNCLPDISGWKARILNWNTHFNHWSWPRLHKQFNNFWTPAVVM